MFVSVLCVFVNCGRHLYVMFPLSYYAAYERQEALSSSPCLTGHHLTQVNADVKPDVGERLMIIVRDQVCNLTVRG